jgi:hypothetical protein
LPQPSTSLSLSLYCLLSFSHAWYSTAVWPAVQLGWRVHSASGELYSGVWQTSPDTALREMRGGRLTCCILLQHKKPMWATASVCVNAVCNVFFSFSFSGLCGWDTHP